MLISAAAGGAVRVPCGLYVGSVTAPPRPGCLVWQQGNFRPGEGSPMKRPSRRASGILVLCLAAVLVGDDAASQVYVKNKRRDCKKVGIDSRLFCWGDDAVDVAVDAKGLAGDVLAGVGTGEQCGVGDVLRGHHHLDRCR